MFTPYINWKLFYPYSILLIVGLIILVLSRIGSAKDRNNLIYLGIFGFVVFLFHLWANYPTSAIGFDGMIMSDPVGYSAAMLIGFCGLAVILMSADFISRKKIPVGEYTSFIVLSAFAMSILAISNELITFFISIETASISFYVLTAMEKNNPKAREAAFKYFVLGSFSAGFLMLGIAFIYGACGTTYFHQIGEILQKNKELSPVWISIGFSLMLIGFGFKLSLVPFHFWTPEVYEGAPTTITAYLATASKVAGFAVFYRFAITLGNYTFGRIDMIEALWFIAFFTIIIGNLMALIQTRFKRMLAFSSVAHSGYLMLAVMAVVLKPELQDSAESALIFYLLIYALMKLLAFGCAVAIGDRGEGEIRDYAGLFEHQPVLALAMVLAMLSLLGIPPTGGFFGKLFVFKAALETGFIYLTIIAILASVISAFYYLRIIVLMIMKTAEEKIYPPPITKRSILILGIISGLIILYGLFPQTILM